MVTKCCVGSWAGRQNRKMSGAGHVVSREQGVEPYPTLTNTPMCCMSFPGGGNRTRSREQMQGADRGRRWRDGAETSVLLVQLFYKRKTARNKKAKPRSTGICVSAGSTLTPKTGHGAMGRWAREDKKRPQGPHQPPCKGTPPADWGRPADTHQNSQ